MKMHGRTFNNCELCSQVRGQTIYDDQTVHLNDNKELGGVNMNANET